MRGRLQSTGRSAGPSEAPIAGRTLAHTHTHTDTELANRAASARLRGLGLRESQARLAARIAELGFPDYQRVADAEGINYEALVSRLGRMRRCLGLDNTFQLMVLIAGAVAGVHGDPGWAGVAKFFSPNRGDRGTIKERER
jgi:hypothetical protein